MSELLGIYTLWLREVKRYTRERTRLISAFFQPLLWLVIFGSGMQLFSTGNAQLSYQEFIFPGIIGQTLLFTSMFMGISVIWDREFGFLKEILVSPISRASIFIGKMLGATTDAVIQGSFVFVLSFLVGIFVDVQTYLICLPIMILITFGLVSIGLTIASRMESLESFGVIQTFVNLPLFFLSGALFPLTRVPDWLRWVSNVNPVTYGVDALRIVILKGDWTPLFAWQYDLLALCVFDAGMIVVGTIVFGQRK
jgi:ABC-2 type transport system permease protein